MQKEEDRSATWQEENHPQGDWNRLKAAEVSDAAAGQAELLSEAWKAGTHPSVWTLDSHPGALKGCFQTRSRVYIPGTIVPLPVLLETGSLED